MASDSEQSSECSASGGGSNAGDLFDTVRGNLDADTMPPPSPAQGTFGL